MDGRSRSRGSRETRSGAALVAVLLLVGSCSTASITPEAGDEPVDPVTAAAAPAPPPAPAEIEHPRGAADVVLRFDWVPDQLDEGELNSSVFRPGPEFTLFGDGTIIVLRNGTPTPPSESPLERAAPFHTARLTGGQVQALLQYALEVGGLATADPNYPSPDTDCFHSWEFTLRTTPVSADVQVFCPIDWPSMNEPASPFERTEEPLSTLVNYLRRFDTQAGIETMPWEPDGYWAILRDPSDGDGAEPLDWPWPAFDPNTFCEPSAHYDYDDSARTRAISAAEASRLGLPDMEGGVQGIPVQSPHGRRTWRLALWPVFPDDDVRASASSTKRACPHPAETPTPEPTPTGIPETSPSLPPSPTPTPSPGLATTPTPWPMAAIHGEGKSQNLPFEVDVVIDHSGVPTGTFTGNMPYETHVVPIHGAVTCARIEGTNVGVLGGRDEASGEAFTVMVSSFPSGMIIMLGRANCDTTGFVHPASHPITEGNIWVFPEPTTVGN
jgi:hypothetical protein